MLVAYLNNPSEEAIFRSNRIKTLKLDYPSLMNSTDQQSKTSQKKAICIIVYSVLTLTVKIFCVLHNKVALLTRDVLSGELEFVTKEF